MKRYIWILFLLIKHIATCQQYDTNYVKMYRHKIIVNPWFGIPSYDLLISPKNDTSKQSQNYISNTKTMAGIDLTYRGLSLSLGLRTPLYANDAKQYGKSKSGALSMRYTHKKWAFEGKYAGYSGFADATKIDSINQVLPFRKDLNAYIVSLGAIYTFKAHKFSYGAAFNYSYRQLRSAWSPLLVFHTYGAQFHAYNSVLDTAFTDHFKKINSFNRSRTFAIGMAPGISGTSVFFKKMFITGILAIGADLQNNRLSKDKRPVHNSVTINPFVDFRFALGYNSNRFFSAITVKTQSLQFDLYKFNIEHAYSLFTIEMGYRFDTPKWVSNTYNKIAGKD